MNLNIDHNHSHANTITAAIAVAIVVSIAIAVAIVVSIAIVVAIVVSITIAVAVSTAIAILGSCLFHHNKPCPNLIIGSISSHNDKPKHSGVEIRMFDVTAGEKIKQVRFRARDGSGCQG